MNQDGGSHGATENGEGNRAGDGFSTAEDAKGRRGGRGYGTADERRLTPMNQDGGSRGGAGTQRREINSWKATRGYPLNFVEKWALTGLLHTPTIRRGLDGGRNYTWGP